MNRARSWGSISSAWSGRRCARCFGAVDLCWGCCLLWVPLFIYLFLRNTIPYRSRMNRGTWGQAKHVYRDQEHLQRSTEPSRKVCLNFSWFVGSWQRMWGPWIINQPFLFLPTFFVWYFAQRTEQIFVYYLGSTWSAPSGWLFLLRNGSHPTMTGFGWNCTYRQEQLRRGVTLIEKRQGYRNIGFRGSNRADSRYLREQNTELQRDKRYRDWPCAVQTETKAEHLRSWLTFSHHVNLRYRNYF